MDDSQRETIIRDAIKACQAKGIGLIQSTWGIEWNKKKERWVSKSPACCALACTILEYQDKLPRNLDWRQWTIDRILDVKGEWVRNFQLGFDGYEKSAYDDGSFAYELGCLFRKEFGFSLACSKSQFGENKGNSAHS
jgi:hypothetical protein